MHLKNKPKAMRLFTFLITLGAICSFSILSSGQTFVDAVVLETHNPQHIKQLSLDPDRSIYVVGDFSSGSPMIEYLGPFPIHLENLYSGFSVKLNSDLDVSWARIFESTQNNTCYGADVLQDQRFVGAFDSNWFINGADTMINPNGGFVITTGPDGVVSDILLAPFDLSGGGITALSGDTILVNSDHQMAKMSLSGTLLWEFPAASGAFSSVHTTSDSLGNSYMVGYYHYGGGPVNIGTDTVIPPVTENTGFICKVDPNGDFQWVRTTPAFASQLYEVCYDVQNDRLIIGGYFEDWLIQPNGDTLWSNGSDDVFIASYSTSGQTIKVVNIGGGFNSSGPPSDLIRAMVVDPGTGSVFTSVNMTANALVAGIPVPPYASLLIKLDEELNPIWFRDGILVFYQNAVLAVDSNHDLLVGGKVDFWDGPIMLDNIELVSPNGIWDAAFVVARLRDDSTHTLVTGRVYVDENQNGTYESSEYFAANWPVFSDQTVSYCSNQGLYSFDFEEGTYPLQALSNTYYTSDPGSVNVVSDQSVVHITQDFRLIPNGELYDVSVDVSADVPPVPGFGQRFVITVRNIGNQVTDALVEFTLDPELVADSVTGNYTMTGTSTYQWSIAGIAPFEHRTFEVYVTVPATSILGDQLTSDATVSIDMTDQDLSNNHDVLTQVIVGSYDPNDKSAEPSGDIGYNELGNGIQYTIRFQNTGTYPALNVRLVDTLTTLLDLTTLQTIAASHNYIETRTDENVVEWLFPEINLPDSTSDEPGSKGFVTFTIHPTSDVGLNDIISNVASIYFDFNEPIITNVVEQTVITGLEELDESDSGLSIWPNPTSDQCQISYKVPVGTRSHLELRDMLGRVVQTVQLPTNEGIYTLDASTLGTGVYFCTLLSGAEVLATQKLSVMRNE
jgi:hypothetical protein